MERLAARDEAIGVIDDDFFDEIAFDVGHGPESSRAITAHRR
jgi:hypothetical protein